MAPEFYAHYLRQTDKKVRGVVMCGADLRCVIRRQELFYTVLDKVGLGFYSTVLAILFLIFLFHRTEQNFGSSFIFASRVHVAIGSELLFPFPLF